MQLFIHKKYVKYHLVVRASMYKTKWLSFGFRFAQSTQTGEQKNRPVTSGLMI